MGNRDKGREKKKEKKKKKKELPVVKTV